MPRNIPIPFPIDFIEIPLSNYRKGRNGKNPVAIVIHIADGSKSAVINTFKNPSTEKSSHFLIGKDGSITQFVSTSNTAYCNGIVDNPINEIVLGMKGNPNDYTISIEHEGFGTEDIKSIQYETTAKLVKFLHDKWDIPLDRTHVFGHREIYSKKTCPGQINIDKVIQLARTL